MHFGLERVVRRAHDPALERLLGSRAALRLLFRAAPALPPDDAAELAGPLGLELRTGAGRVRAWTVVVAPDGRLSARPGRAEDARLTVVVGVADLVRIAAGELDAGTALLTGRLDVRGDGALAARLGALF